MWLGEEEEGVLSFIQKRGEAETRVVLESISFCSFVGS